MTLEWITFLLVLSEVSNIIPESSYPDRVLCGSAVSHRLWDSMSN
jgi:hypothetical protein